MTMFRFASSTALIVVSTFAATTAVYAQDKKQAPPAPPAAAAPRPMPTPAAAPAGPGAAGPAARPAAAPMTPPSKASAPMAPPPAGAAAPAGPPMPTPAKELEAFMKGFEGAWKCDTKFAAGAMGPGSPEMTAKTTVKFKKEFGGFSWHGEYSLAKSKAMPAMSGVMQVGYDPTTSHLTLVGYDSMGGALMGTGPISGDTAIITEDGYMAGMKMKMRETMTKRGPKEIYHKYEAEMGKGFQLMGEDTCKR